MRTSTDARILALPGREWHHQLEGLARSPFGGALVSACRGCFQRLKELRGHLTGGEAGRILASAWLRPQGEPTQKSYWARMVSTPWPGQAGRRGSPGLFECDAYGPLHRLQWLGAQLGALLIAPTWGVDLGGSSTRGLPRFLRRSTGVAGVLIPSWVPGTPESFFPIWSPSLRNG